jgi:hypothetical protein
MFLGEQQDITDPEAAVLVAGQTTGRLVAGQTTGRRFSVRQ